MVRQVNALLAWTRQELWAYIHQHDLPAPALPAGLPERGLRAHTAPVMAGQDERVGR
jgi:3'-phosphoadenosine 5'-phosphosulfate sulfotransferase (PAPS reductase)/FAD synthetase